MRGSRLLLLRALTVATLIVVVFYVTPLRVTVDLGTLVRLAVGLGRGRRPPVIWQLRAIARSAYPVLRAIGDDTVALPLSCLVFAATYTVMSLAQPGSFSGGTSDRTGALYFVITVFATVGFGDIAPVSGLARIVVSIQMIANLLLLGLVLRALLNAVDKGRARQTVRAPSSDPERATEVR